MKSHYNLFIIIILCLFFIFSIALDGEAANVSNVSATPNPFNPRPPDNEITTISYNLTSSALLWLRIYNFSNVLQRTLETPPNNYTFDPTYGTAGPHSITWDGKKDDLITIVPEGIYPYYIDDVAWITSSSTSIYIPFDIVADPTNSNTLWMTRGSAFGGLFKSTDGGSIWTQISFIDYAYGIAISNNGQKIFVLDQDEKLLWRSIDGGVNWTSIALWASSNSPRDIACYGDGTILYAVDSGTKRVYKSTNSGDTWNSGTLLNNSVTLSGVAVDPNDSNIVLVADVGATTAGSSYPTVYKSIDGGTSFSTALDLKGTANGRFLGGNGAYQISIDTSGYYWVSDRGNHRIQQFDSNNNWIMTVGGTASGVAADNYKFNANGIALGIFVNNFGGQQQYLYVADYQNFRIKKYAYDNYTSNIIVTSDKIAPAAITNLSLIGATSQLTWTAPGDDDNNPGTKATSYDIRCAKTQIATDSDFNNATPVTGEPTPSLQGTTEYFWVTAEAGLDSNTAYYCAIKSSDEYNANTSPLSNPPPNPPNPSVKTGLLYGWNMVSCPKQPSPNDSNSVFGDDAGLDWMWYWNSTWTGAGSPDSAGYWGRATTIIPGKGILIYSYISDLPTDANGTDITNATYTIPLNAGWNIIGNPYGTNVNLSNCHVIYNSTEKSYLDAVTAGWIGNAVYIWNGSTYIDYPWDSAKLEPWKGYWIMSYYGLNLIIYKP